LGFFVRVGRNAHTELLHLIATGERGFVGFVIDAHNAEHHRVLITKARRHDLDVILDPKTQQMGFPGAHTQRLAALPWLRHVGMRGKVGKQCEEGGRSCAKGG